MRLLAFLLPGGAFLDLGCGPSNVGACVGRWRPDAAILGVDLAPNVILEARAGVPGARFVVADGRDLKVPAGPIDRSSPTR